MATPNPTTRRTIRGKLLRFALPATVLIFVAALTLTFLRSRTTELQFARTRAVAGARQEAARLDRELALNAELGAQIALVMETNRTRSRAEVIDYLGEQLGRHPRLLGTYVAFEPGAFDGADERYSGAPGHDATGRFLPYWNKLTGTTTLDPIVDVDTSDFYTVPQRTLAPVILEPYLYQGTLLTSFVSPIVRGGRFLGIGGVDVSLASLHDQVAAIRTMPGASAFLISPTGSILAGGAREDVGRRRLPELAPPAERPAVEQAVRRSAVGEEAVLDLAEFGGRKDVTLVGVPIRSSGWALVTVVPRGELLAPLRLLTTQLVLLGVAALALLGAFLTGAARQIARPIVELEAAASRAAAGDLTTPIDVRSDDEVGSLADSFRAMLNEVRRRQETIEQENERLQAQIGELLMSVATAASGDLTVRATVTEGTLGNVADGFNVLTENFGELVAALQEAIGRLVDSSGELASTSLQLETGSARQVAELDRTRETAQTMASGLQAVSAEATRASDVASRADREAHQGNEVVREVVQGMAVLRQSVAAGAKKLKVLGDRTLEISAITNTIREIAAQTGILALNAGLEAGRAGELGRGFAVVAEEVRRLNERVAGAARDIERLVGGIQQETGEAISTIEQQTIEVERQSELVSSAGSALDRIRLVAQQTAEIVRDIDAGARQQAAGSREVAGAMQAVLEIARKAEREVAQAHQATEALAQLAATLAGQVSRYRVGRG